MRASVSVRVATPDDLPDLVALWRELTDLGRRSERTLPLPSREGELERLLAQDDPDSRVLVASIGEDVVGGVLLSHQPLAPMFEARAVHLQYLHVRMRHRRRGVGSALVAGAVAYAEECGVEHVVTSVYPELRDVNRFFARLGFGPMVLRRVAPVSLLRRKLAMGPRTPAVEELLLQRRSVRSRRLRTALARTRT